MALTAQKIKQQLWKNGIKIPDIAKKFKCPPQIVHQLMRHKAVKSGRPYEMRIYIAKSIGKNFKEVWE